MTLPVLPGFEGFEDRSKAVAVPASILEGLNFLKESGFSMYIWQDVVKKLRQYHFKVTAEWVEKHLTEYADGVLYGFKEKK